MIAQWMRRFICTLCLISLLSSCVDVPDDITGSFDLTVDTGQNLQDLVDAAMADLLQAEEKAGAEVRETIEQAISKLQEYAAYIAGVFVDGLDTTIATLDAAVQGKLRWIQIYTEQVRSYALEIIHAAGAEAQETIQQAAIGMRRTLREAETAAEQLAYYVTGNMLVVVDTVADRSLTIGGIAAGVLLTFICAYGWGRLIYQRRLPAAGLQRGMAFGFLAMSVIFSLAPFSLLAKPVRAYALTSAGKGTAIAIPIGRPSVYNFQPDPLIIPAQNSFLLVHGAELDAAGEPVVTFGGKTLAVVGLTSDGVSVDISEVSSDPSQARAVKVQFNTTPAPILASVPVWTATPEPIVLLRTVPNIVGMTFPKAKATLTSEGLTVGVVQDEAGKIVLEDEADRVLSSAPEAGREVPQDFPVALVVSKTVIVRVPSLVGFSLDDARAALAKAGLSVGRVANSSGNPVNDVRIGKVIASNPSAGTSAILNSPVDLVMSEPVTAQFDISQPIGVIPFNVTFTDRSTGPITRVQWNFGDGNISNDRSPAPHTYSSSGLYQVTLTVWDDSVGTSDTKSADIKVHPFFKGAVFFKWYRGLVGGRDYDTGIDRNQYYCGIVGLEAFGDIKEDGRGDIVKAYVRERGMTWWITASFRTEDPAGQKWNINIMCLDRRVRDSFSYFSYGWAGRDRYPGPASDPNTALANTQMSGNEYYCGIVGFAALDGDIQENGVQTRVFEVMPSLIQNTNTWGITADVATHQMHERWETLDVLCMVNDPPGLFAFAQFQIPGGSDAERIKRNDGAPYLRDNYICGLVGMGIYRADIDEKDYGQILTGYLGWNNQGWFAIVDFSTEGYAFAHERRGAALCVSTAIAEEH